MSEVEQYFVWSHAARRSMAETITRMGLNACAVCHSASSLSLLPHPAVLPIGGWPWRPVGESHRGNVLFMAIVRCEACGHVLLFDSEKLNASDQPVLWHGPGQEPEPAEAA